MPNQLGNVPTIHGVALLASESLRGRWQNRITVQATDDERHFLVWSDGDVQFIGLYLPPVTTRESLARAQKIVIDATREADKQPKSRRFVLGDFNDALCKKINRRRTMTVLKSGYCNVSGNGP
jgi:exonuclease III